MRSDKEQLDIILQRKSTAERKRKRNRRILYSTLALFLCVSVTLGFVLVSGGSKNRKESFNRGDASSVTTPSIGNADGVIGGDRNEGEGYPTADEDLRLEAGEVLEDFMCGTMYPGEGTPNTAPTAGTLSGGEIKDNAEYDKWLEAVKEEAWGTIGTTWQLPTAKRITVKTEGCAGAVVELLDADGKVLYGAVSNADGVAYLFADEQASIKTVKVTAGGKTATQSYDGTEYSFDVEKQGVSTKLDLMFVVDTTGSMGDELEYLKAEIADVIDRVSGNNVTVRTSVNFYRDEGDEYVVKYYGFKDNSAEVQQIVAEQRADGGGDYEEAVHTALSNAVLEHQWEKDSVKVMFLVLDAPPHNNSEVAASLSASVKQAAAMGIRIIPVASSGISKETEGLLRTMALLTGGSYTFLTNHSGIGNSHLPPSTDDYKVEALNDMLVRIALEYCGIKTEITEYPTADSTEDTEYSQ